MENFNIQISVNTVDYEIRMEQYEGREHIVVPVVMMVQGVHNGSRGPILHSSEELGHIPVAFDGIPVTIQHPKDNDNNYISANTPNTLQEYAVGRIFSSYFENDKLKGEAWLDIQRLATLSPDALEYIQNGSPLDVSLGIFTDEEDIEGEWNGETYIAIARNHRADHLALLPGGTGACSWSDGCGIRVNLSNKEKTKKKGGNNVSVNKEDNKFPDVFQKIKDLNTEGLSVHKIICLAEKGFKELVDNARNKLDRMDDDMKMHFLEEMYENYIVYEVRRRDGASDLYRREYSVNDSGEIEFTSDPTPVNRTVDYVVQEMKRTKFNNNNKKGETMAEKKHDCQTCEEKIVKLIANESTNFTEDDRDWLTAMSEDQLDKLAPKEKKETKLVPEINKEKPIEALSEEDKAALAYGRSQLKARKTELIQSIQSNAEGVWKEEELVSQEIEDLEKIDKAIRPVTDYSVAGGTHTQYEEEEILFPTGYGAEKEKSK